MNIIIEIEIAVSLLLSGILLGITFEKQNSDNCRAMYFKMKEMLGQSVEQTNRAIGHAEFWEKQAKDNGVLSPIQLKKHF